MHCVLCYDRYERVRYVCTSSSLYVHIYTYINASGVNLQDREDNSMTVRTNAKLLSIEVLPVERHSSASGEIKSNV